MTSTIPIERITIKFSPDSVAMDYFPASKAYTYRELAEAMHDLLYHRGIHGALIAGDMITRMVLPYSIIDVNFDDGAVTIYARPYGEEKRTKLGEEVFVNWFTTKMNEIAKGSFALVTEITIR